MVERRKGGQDASSVLSRLHAAVGSARSRETPPWGSFAETSRKFLTANSFLLASHVPPRVQYAVGCAAAALAIGLGIVWVSCVALLQQRKQAGWISGAPIVPVRTPSFSSLPSPLSSSVATPELGDEPLRVYLLPLHGSLNFHLLHQEWRHNERVAINATHGVPCGWLRDPQPSGTSAAALCACGMPQRGIGAEGLLCGDGWYDGGNGGGGADGGAASGRLEVVLPRFAHGLSATIEQYAAAYWLTLSLLTGVTPSVMQRVASADEADIIFVPYFSSLSYAKKLRRVREQRKQGYMVVDDDESVVEAVVGTCAVFSSNSSSSSWSSRSDGRGSSSGSTDSANRSGSRHRRGQHHKRRGSPSNSGSDGWSNSNESSGSSSDSSSSTHDSSRSTYDSSSSSSSGSSSSSSRDSDGDVRWRTRGMVDGEANASEVGSDGGSSINSMNGSHDGSSTSRLLRRRLLAQSADDPLGSEPQPDTSAHEGEVAPEVVTQTEGEAAASAAAGGEMGLAVAKEGDGCDSFPLWQSRASDFVVAALHPWALTSAWDRLSRARFLMVDFSNPSEEVAHVHKDVIVPYSALMPPYTDDTHTPWSKRRTLVFFRGRVDRKQTGTIRKALVAVLANVTGADVGPGRASEQGVAEAVQGMRSSKFCLSPAGDTTSACRLFDAIMSHCIPVVVSDDIDLPFEDVLDYSSFALFLPQQLAVRPGFVEERLRAVSDEEGTRMWRRLKEVRKHFTYGTPPLPGGAEAMIWQAIRRRKRGGLYNYSNRKKRRRMMVQMLREQGMEASDLVPRPRQLPLSPPW